MKAGLDSVRAVFQRLVRTICRTPASHNQDAQRKDQLCHLHGSLVGRSFTDPVTNSTLLSEVDLHRHLGQALKGSLPLDCLLTFVHEFTHHWCFHSPVGIAVAILFLEARRGLLRAPSGQSGLRETLDNIARFETAVALFRPLAEGMAMFAELDAVTGGAPVMSETARCTLRLFAAPHLRTPGKVTAKDINRLAFGLFHQVRLSHRGRLRKADILLRPYSFSDGGYLSGYLAMKNLWTNGLRSCPRFVDTDLFLGFARHHFYEDFSLVAVLLNRDIPIELAPDAIVRAFFARLRMMTSPDIQRRLKRFERAALDRVPPDAQCSTVEEKFGAQLLQQRIANLIAEDAASEDERVLGVLDSATVQGRMWMRVGVTDVNVAISDKGRILAGPENTEDARLLICFTADKSLFGYNGVGAVEVFIAPTSDSTVICLSINGRVANSTTLRSTSTDENLLAEFGRVYTVRKRGEDFTRQAIENLEELIGSREEAELVNQFRARQEFVVRSIYQPVSLLYTPDMLIENAVRELSDAGFERILGPRAQLLEDAAEIALATMFGGSLEILANTLKRDASALRDSVAEINQKARTWLGYDVIKEIPEMKWVISFI